MKRSHLFTFLVFALTLAFVAGLVGPVSAGRTTRDLVFEEEDEAAKPEAGADKQAVVSVKTLVKLKRDGKEELVSPNYQFKSGDKLKLVYTTNIDCYVYWLSEGSSGDVYVLFPNPNDERIGGDNWVKKNSEHAIPVFDKGWFTIKHKSAGQKESEKILLIMAPEKVPELEEAAKVAGIKGGKMPTEALDNLKKDQDTKRKSRDLVFEEEESDESGILTQSQVSTDISQPFVVAFELVHSE
jgi:hypothetical protein